MLELFDNELAHINERIDTITRVRDNHPPSRYRSLLTLQIAHYNEMRCDAEYALSTLEAVA